MKFFESLVLALVVIVYNKPKYENMKLVIIKGNGANLLGLQIDWQSVISVHIKQ